jgi:hypothetical protein
MINVATNVRIGIGASYRFVAGVSSHDLRNSDVSGLSAILTLKFGKF